MEDRIVCNSIMDEVNKVIIGKEDVVKKILACFLAKGNVLIEDIPGVGKTTMAVAFAKAINIKVNRIQFTPDVMPSDVVGFTMFDQSDKTFKYKEGVVFCNLLLADEINRTSSKTQSALLESMEEKRVTVDGVVWELPDPFMVIATQNPVGSAGTHSLPESQLDRFMIKISVGYPEKEREIDMLKNKESSNPLEEVKAVASSEIFKQLQERVSNIFIHDKVYKFIIDIIDKTRNNDDIELGVSPRGSLAISNMARANAFLAGRDYVTPDDVIEVAGYTLSHRIIMAEKGGRFISSEEILNSILRETKVDEK